MTVSSDDQVHPTERLGELDVLLIADMSQRNHSLCRAVSDRPVEQAVDDRLDGLDVRFKRRSHVWFGDVGHFSRRDGDDSEFVLRELEKGNELSGERGRVRLDVGRNGREGEVGEESSKRLIALVKPEYNKSRRSATTDEKGKKSRDSLVVSKSERIEGDLVDHFGDLGSLGLVKSVEECLKGNDKISATKIDNKDQGRSTYTLPLVAHVGDNAVVDAALDFLDLGQQSSVSSEARDVLCQVVGRATVIIKREGVSHRSARSRAHIRTEQGLEGERSTQRTRRWAVDEGKARTGNLLNARMSESVKVAVKGR